MENDLQTFDPFSPTSSGGHPESLTSPLSSDGESRQAILREKNGVYYLENFDPGQPASINGKAVRPGSSVVLKDGDSVQLGSATPLKFTYSAMGGSAKSNPRFASVQKSVHFNDHSPKVFEVTPDQKNSEHKSLKGRKQTPLSGFLSQRSESPGKCTSRHERPIGIQHSSVERPARPIIAKAITPLKGSAQNQRPKSAIVKRANTLDDLTKIAASEPRGRPMKKSSSSASVSHQSRPFQRSAQPKKYETPKMPATKNRLLGVTPVVDGVKKTAFPRFPANPVTSSSKSESRVQFALNNRRQMLAGHYSAQPSRNVRPSRSFGNLGPCSPEDMSLANVSEWVDNSATSPEELLTLDNSHAEMNRRLSVQEEEVLTDEDEQAVATTTPAKRNSLGVQYNDASEQPPESAGRKSRRSSSAPELSADRRRRSQACVEHEQEPVEQVPAPSKVNRRRSKRPSMVNQEAVDVVQPEPQVEHPKSVNRRKSRMSVAAKTPEVQGESAIGESVAPFVEESTAPHSAKRRKSMPKTPVAQVELAEPTNEEAFVVVEPIASRSANRRKSRRSAAPKTPVVEVNQLLENSEEAQISEIEPAPAVETTNETEPAPPPRSANRRKSRRSSVAVVQPEEPPALDETYELVEDVPGQMPEPPKSAKKAEGESAMNSPMPFTEHPMLSPTFSTKKKQQTSAKKPKTPNMISPPRAKVASQEQLTPMPFAEHPLISPPFSTKKKAAIAKKATPKPKDTINSPMPFAEHPVISPSFPAKKPTKKAKENLNSPMPFTEHPMISPTFSAKKKTAKKDQIDSAMPFSEHPIVSPSFSAKKKPRTPKPVTNSPMPFAEHPIISPMVMKKRKASDIVEVVDKVKSPEALVSAPVAQITPVLTVETTSPKKSARKTAKSAKRSMGVTFAEQEKLKSPGDQPVAKKSLHPARGQVTPANLNKFRPSIGTSPGHRGSLRKAMLKRIFELKKTDADTVPALPTSPEIVSNNRPTVTRTSPLKKPVKHHAESQMMTPDPMAMKKMFGIKKKRNTIESPNLAPGEINRLFEAPKSKTKNRQSAILSPVAMKKMFKEKNKAKGPVDPDRRAMKSLFRETVSSSNKKVKAVDPIISPIPMQNLFNPKKPKEKAPEGDILSPNALKRIFLEKNLKQRLELDEELPLPELFVEPQPQVVERQQSQESEDGSSKTKKTARFAEPVIQRSPEKPAVVETEPEIEQPAKRGRGRKAKPVEESSTVEQQVQEIPSKARRGRKAAAEKPQEEPVVEKEEPIPAPSPKKRGRKAAVPVVEEVQEEPVSEAPKRGRKKRTVPDPQELEEPVAKQPSPPPTKTSRGRGRTAKVVEAENQVEDEPPAPVTKPKRTKTAPVPVEEVEVLVENGPAKKPKRGQKMATVPEEVEVAAEPVETKPKRGRGKKEQPVDVVEPEPTLSKRGKKQEEPAAAPKLPRKSTIRVTRAMSKTEEPVADKKQRSARK